ncbi:MAG TPA: carboxypeptidase-like regulatory domain-containing protein [Dinghuibacter sp.]|jgi:hypothetical protein|uniref:carboxypeptidase-like regulatory domain-containing protein n=1 Tax=Dinghuibacter sp. TaxID=2024697 RepID=UPI002C3ED4EE|nr:carboxypeptidase-like regulatory domain-containing protein [Dinghuibacter sp.]HTJ14258.1 carboxypeptidase-like regulatory domain-containing protein [Dinghuibacter sp.]
MRFILLCSLLTLPFLVRAQQDSIVEVNGIVLSKDSLRPMAAVSIVIRGTKRGTITNEKGGFGVVALVGQEIDVTNVGYLAQHFTVESGDNKAHVIILQQDTAYLESLSITNRPSKEQFSHDFVTSAFRDKDQETAKKNVNPKDLKIIAKGVPLDASEKADRTLTQQAHAQAVGNQVPDLVGVNLLQFFGNKKKKSRPLPPLHEDLVNHALQDSLAQGLHRDTTQFHRDTTQLKKDTPGRPRPDSASHL